MFCYHGNSAKDYKVELKMLNFVIFYITFSIANYVVYSLPIAIETREVSKNVYSFSPGGGGKPSSKYSMFIVTCDGVIAIEPFNPMHSKQFINAIKLVTNLPIKYLLISHNHWDHSRGGELFKAEGAKVMAHEETVAWMRDNPSPDGLYIPDTTWSGQRKDIHLCDVIVELYYFGINHGYGMTVMLYKSPQCSENNILYIADLITPRAVLFRSMPDSNMKETERTLKEVVKLDFDQAVFSHNGRKDPLAGGNKKDIENLIRYIVALRAGVDALFTNGTNPFKVTILKLPEFKDWQGYDAFLSLNIQKFVFERRNGPYPWRQISHRHSKKSNLKHEKYYIEHKGTKQKKGRKEENRKKGRKVGNKEEGIMEENRESKAMVQNTQKNNDNYFIGKF